MSIREDISGYSLMQNDTPEQPLQINYHSLPMKAMYETMKEPKEDNEYKTFKNFLQFKSYLDFTEMLEHDGVITINRPQEVIEVEEKKKSPVWVVIVIGFVLVKIGMLLA